MLAPEFLYQFTSAKDAVTQQLDLVHRAIDSTGLGVSGFLLPVYVVPPDRIFCLTHGCVRITMQGGIPAVVNTLLEMTYGTNLRHRIAQTEEELAGLGLGRYRGICEFSGEVWYYPGMTIQAVGSWGPVVDDYAVSAVISGITFPRGSITLG